MMFNLFYYIKGKLNRRAFIGVIIVAVISTTYYSVSRESLLAIGTVKEYTPTLHILTCGTGTNGVHEVLHETVSRIHGASLINLCEHSEWTGFFLKIEQVNNWLKNKQLPQDDLVLFIDGRDVLFNYVGDSSSLAKDLKRYMGSAEMMYMAESSLWMGFIPKDSGVNDLYYDLWENDYTTCPKYVNSGGWIATAGYAEFAVGAMLDADSHESEADDLLSQNYGVDKGLFHRDDQAALTRLRSFYPDKIKGDYHQNIFASLWDVYPCPNDVECPTNLVINCGHVERCYEEFTMRWTLQSDLPMTRVSQWSKDCKLNPEPILLHANGGEGKPHYFKKIAEPLLGLLNDQEKKKKPH